MLYQLMFHVLILVVREMTRHPLKIIEKTLYLFFALSVPDAEYISTWNWGFGQCQGPCHNALPLPSARGKYFS